MLSTFSFALVVIALLASSWPELCCWTNLVPRSTKTRNAEIAATEIARRLSSGQNNSIWCVESGAAPGINCVIQYIYIFIYIKYGKSGGKKIKKYRLSSLRCRCAEQGDCGNGAWVMAAANKLLQNAGSDVGVQTAELM